VSGPKPRPVAERFWEKVDKTDGCWLWTASRTTSGYGQFCPVGNVPRKAHRIAWELTYGPVPEGAHVLHRCDTPLCVRPDHLFLGDAAANVDDMWTKSRAYAQTQTHCQQGHEFTPENTYTWNANRYCRECGRTYSRNYMRRRRAAPSAQEVG